MKRFPLHASPAPSFLEFSCSRRLLVARARAGVQTPVRRNFRRKIIKNWFELSQVHAAGATQMRSGFTKPYDSAWERAAASNAPVQETAAAVRRSTEQNPDSAPPD